MSIILSCIAIFILGILMGLWIGLVIHICRGNRNPTIGSLRVDNSDDEPYLFLELTAEGRKQIYTNKRVSLDVKIQDYLPHE